MILETKMMNYPNVLLERPTYKAEKFSKKLNYCILTLADINMHWKTTKIKAVRY